jgi:Zn-dependent metalloprotease
MRTWHRERMRCAIVPPHVLESVAERARDSALRDIARRALVSDGANRITRRVGVYAVPTPAATAPAAAPAKRTVYNAGNAETLPGDVAREEGHDATGDKAVDQNYDWLGATFELYAKAFNRNSIDGAGLALKSTVHYGKEYNNAFWNGEQMVYGDGDGRLFLPFTGPIDVTGHELTHGVTQFTAGLEYFSQPGALNESMSDVFGSLVKQHHLGQTAEEADWLIGTGLFGPEVDNATALRSMKEPGSAYEDDVLGKDPQPGHMDDYDNTPRDNQGVHINSGIPNRAFYLCATAIGGHAWEKAGKVWYDTLTGGAVKRDTDFAAFAAATKETASRLYGSSSAEAKAVSDAWNEVGVTE